MEEQALLQSPAGKEWNKVGVRHHHGIAVPIFSLRSQQSLGIGEYLDFIPLINWCQELGLDVIQTLPLNDTGNDISPYSALTAFGLNPIHLSLFALPYLQESQKLQSLLHEAQPALNEKQRVDYPAVQQLKRHFFQMYFEEFGSRFLANEEYQQFCQKQKYWLSDYALFKTLKEVHQWQGWETWNISPHDFKDWDKYKKEIDFHSVLQFLCYQQMMAVKQHAVQNNVFLKGDIPILINRESADVWSHSHLFQLQCTAGAPPDMYAELGQNWGFPLYNWEAMHQENCQWWRERLQFASDFYHIYRIDHIVGFFRIWAIPQGRPGKDGKYLPEDHTKWIPQGTAIMKVMLETASMLPIGEDLGNVPNEVRRAIRELGICGTKVIRWERKWEGDQSFIPYAEYIPESMTTVSTHDSETLQQWWRNQPAEAKEFAKFKGWEYSEHLPLEKHREILYDSHHTKSLFHINLLQEYLALIPDMTWPLLDDERINMPGVVSEKNWSYRFRQPLEEIVASQPLKQLIKSLL